MSRESTPQVNTQQSSSAPWDVAQPALKKAISGANDLYSSGQGFQPYTKSMVVPESGNTTLGKYRIASGAARYDQDLQRPMEHMAGQFETGGYNQEQRAAVDQLSSIADGSQVGGTNPAFMDVLRQSQDATRDSINAMAMANGRYSSGAHQGVMGDSIGDLTNKALYGEYVRQQGRQDQAIQGLFNAGQQGQSNLMAASAAMPGAYATSQSRGRDLMALGSMDEDLVTRQLNDSYRIHNEQQAAPWNRLNAFNSIASGAGGLGSQTTGGSTAQAPKQSPFQSALGGAAAGYGAGGIGGALLGGAAGLFL